MSYRELRDTAEILRTLGFPRLISIENFRLPNFLLMAEILEWIVLKFDLNLRILKNIETETDRVIFVKTCVVTLIQKGRIFLNPINLYRSDGHAVREILTILKKFYYATKKKNFTTLKTINLNNTTFQLSILQTKINLIRQELKFSSSLANEISQKAANIYDLLRKEILAKEIRNKVLSNHLNTLDIEKEINELIKEIDKKTVKIEHKISNIANDEQDLEQKIERRYSEYNQLQKRLIKLQSYQPSYMDKYKQYENKLKNLFNTYIVLFRNLSYLQVHLYELEKAERQNLEIVEQNTRLAVDKLRVKNDVFTVSIHDNSDFKESLNTPQKTQEVRLVGNMVGAGILDDDVEDEIIEENNIKNVYDSDDSNNLIKKNSESSLDDDTLLVNEIMDELNILNKFDFKDNKLKTLEAIIENENDEENF